MIVRYGMVEVCSLLSALLNLHKPVILISALNLGTVVQNIVIGCLICIVADIVLRCKADLQNLLQKILSDYACGMRLWLVMLAVKYHLSLRKCFFTYKTTLVVDIYKWVWSPLLLLPTKYNLPYRCLLSIGRCWLGLGSNPAGVEFQWQPRWCIWPCLVSDWLAGGLSEQTQPTTRLACSNGHECYTRLG